MAHTAARCSSLLTEYFCSHEFKNRDAYAMVAPSSGVSCLSAAPIPSWLASQMLHVFQLLTKCLFSVIFLTAIIMLRKAFSFSSFHTKLNLLIVDSRGRKEVRH